MGEKNDELRRYVVTPLQTNCLAYVSDGECLVVDPGGSGDQLATVLDDVRVTCVAATHGHGDHVGGVAALMRATGAPFAIHAADVELARHAGEMSEVGRSYDENAPDPDRTLAEGDVLRVGTATFTVMETPGHTPGGIVLVGGGSAEGVAFVGDTLFPGSHGRTDLKGGDEETIMASLARMAAEIAPDTTLVCGHGPATTMARELAVNPFLR
ncbi:MAG TPA: MBL fold metallo-hydrolase [Candidatus Olsenella excrementavium]|uniref:MBL fold metallo-hydrolase n=1 Tax=Candidatus Olsenella excrementavium TaxID=2838709 RepID=A0A9D2CI39_9ACTN|nr:MBL fold metallo-hydrolase [Candidatus Olsenella excrementavium]